MKLFKKTRIVSVSALSLALMVVLSACSFLEPEPIQPPSPAPTVVDPSTLIGGVIEPSGTTWTGKDSGGDYNRFTLKPGGSVDVTFGLNSYFSAADTWKVHDGVLTMSIFIDDSNGTAEYTGTWDPASNTLKTQMKTSKSNQELTVDLTQVK